MRFISENGKVFDTIEACKAEESKIAEARAKAEAEAAERKAKKEALAKERATRAKEVEDAIKHANTLMDAFVRDYGSFHMSINEDNHLPFNSLLDAIFGL